MSRKKEAFSRLSQTMTFVSRIMNKISWRGWTGSRVNYTPVFTPKCTGNFDNCYELNAKTSSKAPWSYDNNLLCMCPFVTYLDSQAYCLCKLTRETDKAVFRRIRSYTSRSNSIHFHRKPLELHLWSIWSFIFLYSQREQLIGMSRHIQQTIQYCGLTRKTTRKGENGTGWGKRNGPSSVIKPLHPGILPDISMRILHTLLCTFPKRLTRRICFTIKSCFGWWSAPLFS